MTLFKRAEHLAWRNLGEHTIVIDSRVNKEVHHLNEVGTFLWNLCDGTNSLDHIKSKLIEEYEIDSSTANSDVEQFLSELKNKSLLE